MSQHIEKVNIRKNSLAILLSFGLPVVIMALSYYLIGIYPTSDRTILASDGFGQLVNFYSGFNHLLHGEQSFFYTWNGSLGVNFVSLMSYYTNSLFSFLVYFFDNSQMPDAMYIILLVKIGAMGATFWIFANRTFQLPEWSKVILSVSYALMSFTIAYSIMLMWLDALIYLPLILLGIQRLMDLQKPTLLFVSYLLLFVTNYYMAFMVGVFSFLYFFVRVFTDWQRYKKAIFPYFIASLLAGGASMIIILPSVFDLRTNGEALDNLNHFFTNDMGSWDLVVKSMSGVYDTTKFGSGPFIYIGLLPVVFCLFYFVSNKIPLKNKVLYGSLLVFMAASVYIQPLNLIWQGMHSPNMFLFRYSFLYSALLLILAGFGLEKFEKKDLNTLGNIMLIVMVVFIVVTIISNKKRYGYITQESLIVTVILLLIYLVFFILKEQEHRYVKWLPLVLAACVCGELSFNTHQMILGINREWGYTNRRLYKSPYKEIKPLVEQANSNTDSFYRMENLDEVSRTDSFNYNYSGITMFSSIRNRHSSQYLDRLGYRSPNTNLTIQYKNNTLLMDDLLGVKYNLAKNDPQKYGFEKVATKGSYSLYENKQALSLGMLTDKGIYQTKNNNNQTALIQYLAERKASLFQFTDLNEVSRKNIFIREEGNFTYFSEESNDEEKSITWTVDVPGNAQAYLNLDARASDGLDNGLVKVNVAGQEITGGLASTGSYYNLGYYNKAVKVEVTVKFIGSSVVKLVRPSVFILKTDSLDQAIKAIKKKEVDLKVKGNQTKAQVDLEQAQVLFTTIPYDAGWQAQIDGKPAKIKAVQDALITINIPKGKHTVRLVYYPKGMKLGSGLFISCVLLFYFYAYWYTEKIKKGQKVE